MLRLFDELYPTHPEDFIPCDLPSLNLELGHVE